MPEFEQEEDLSYLVFAVVRLQSLFRGKRERRRTSRLVKAHYQITKDPTTEQTLYTNLVSNTSSWNKPALFTTLGIGDDENDEDEDADFDEFHLEAEQDDGDEDDDEDAEDIKKSRRKFPRSKAQQRVDEVEDDGKEGTELDMSGLNAWKLSSRIWNLQFVKKLVLSKNQLQRIPSGIQDLVHLEELDVSYNHLTRLPSCLQTTVTLTALNASHNCIHVFSPKLWKLRAMRRLDLSHNVLQELPYVVGDLKLLRETQEWQVGVGLLTELRSLMLSHNKLTQLPKLIEKCTSLEFLNLSNNSIGEMAEKLGDLESLRCLYLQKNALTALPESIGNLSKLEILEVKENRLVNVPASAGNLQNLQQLGLSSNQLKYLPEELGALGRLSRLDLDNNPNLVTLDVLFRRLSSIRSFSANSCGVVRFGTTEFLKDSPVQSLHLRQNVLSEFPVIFSSSVMKDTLEELVLHGNCLTRFPIEVARWCHELRHLDISENKLHLLPPEIGRLQSLEVLYLSQNELEVLPDELTTLSRLQDLKCDHNRLRNLPLGIGSLAQLTHMDVSFNQLETLPTSMMALSALASLQAHDNQLKVHPPALYHASCYCDYSNNPFNDENNRRAMERRQILAEAMRLMAEQQYEAAEVLFSTLLNTLDMQPQQVQKEQRPQLHFARGNCRFMLFKLSNEKIDASSMTVDTCERELHGKDLLYARWAVNQQKKQRQEDERRQREQERVINNNNSHDDGGCDDKKALERKKKSIVVTSFTAAAHISLSGPETGNDDVTTVEIHSHLAEAAEKRRVARERQYAFAKEALVDFQAAIRHGVTELPTTHYLEGLTHMALMQFPQAVASFTEALMLIIPSPQSPSEQDNNFEYREQQFADYLLSEPVPKIAIHVFLKRAEASRLLGQLPSALADVRHVLMHHPVDCPSAVEDVEQAYAHEWDVQQNEYFVDHVTLFRAFDVAHRSGLARRPEVVNLHCGMTSQGAKKKRAEADGTTRKLRPAERFAAEVARIAAEISDKRIAERAAIADKFVAKEKLLARTRDFKREIRANLELEMEEARQRAVEKELARLAELKRLELEREFNERLFMKYEEELMRWLVGEELRLEMERLRLLEETQCKADAKAAYATRLARRGGRRQQATPTRGAGSRAPSQSTTASSLSSSAASTPATRRTHAPSSPSRVR